MLPAHVTPSTDVLFSEMADESVLLNLQSERYFILDDIGTRMWQLLAQNGDTAAVLDILLKEYDVDEATLRQDLAKLLTELADANLVQIES
jgi:hypothetical protein